jgi:uncharacterized protein YjgD (DUF1641 family)
MAKPLTLQIPPRDARAELVAKLQSAPVKHAAAILDWYELLQELHDSGLMSTLRGAAGEGGQIVTAISAGLNTPESIRAMRNMMVIAKLVGKMDPEIFRGLVNAVPESLTDANARQAKTPGMWRLFRSFTSRESRRTLGILAGMLNAVGRALEPHPKGTE